MTIRELRQIIDCFPEECEVIFTPDDYCGSGYPEWEYADARREQVDTGDEIGYVMVLLKGERSDAH